jgi:hypothetical protein
MKSRVENYVLECPSSYKQYNGEDNFRIRRVAAETCTNICAQFYHQQIARHIHLSTYTGRYATMFRILAAILWEHLCTQSTFGVQINFQGRKF